MKKSVQLAFLILFVLLAYFGIRTLVRGSDPAVTTVTGAQTVLQTEANAPRPDVLFTLAEAEPHPIFLTLKGRTAPNRTVTVRSATTGMVVATPAAEGQHVNRGTILCRLDVEAREARIAEAEALVTSRRVDYQAAADLAEKGWSSPNRATGAKASLDAAEAALNSARIELSRTRITAPFSGVFETRMAETGDFLTPGGACGVVAELDPIRIEADVTEAFSTSMSQGAAITVEVAGFEPREAKLSYISRMASQETRTFRIEATLDNAGAEISAGLTTNLRVQTGEALATRLSSALLTLHDDGRIGVRYLDDSNTVRFAETEIVDDTGDAIWVTGLPARTRLLSFGQEYIKDGTVAVPINAAGAGLQ